MLEPRRLQRMRIVGLLLVACALIVTSSSRSQTLDPVLAGIDVYGTDRFDAAELRAAFPDLFDRFAVLMVAQDMETLEPMLEDLEAWVDARGPFALTDFSVQSTPDPANRQLLVRIGVDVVEPEDVARRMPFRAPPDAELPDPGGALALWTEYEAKGMELAMSGGLPTAAGDCPALHCVFFFEQPDLEPYLDRIDTSAEKYRDELFAIAERSANPEYRARAIFLLAHSADAESLLPLLGRAIYDENGSVRNNAMRVMMYMAMDDPSQPFPIEALAAALDFPSESDRNKAAYTVRWAAEFEPHRARIIATALPTLLQLLRSDRPNIHEPAYEALQVLSGRDYADRDYAAWDAWAASRAATTADVPATR
jgi:hypothetical protein